MTVQPDQTDIRRDLVSLLPRLRRFALVLTGQAQIVDELVREACAQTVIQAPKFGDGDRLESRVFSQIRAIWTEDSKKRKSRLAEDLNGTGFTGHQALLDLPEGAAPAFLLVAVEDHSYSQAAAILGISDDAIAAHVATARLQFAELMADTAERRA